MNRFLCHGTLAVYLDSDLATSFLCFTEHSRQQRGLSTAHMSNHSNKGASWHTKIYSANKKGEFLCETPIILPQGFYFYPLIHTV